MSGCTQFSYTDVSSCACGYVFRDDEATLHKPFARGLVHFVRCPECQSYRQSPAVDDASLAAWYDSEAYQQASAGGDGPYLDYLAEEQQRRLEAASRYHHDLKRELPPAAQVLEVGCATGSLLRVMADQGHHAHGVEISSSFASKAWELNQVPVEVCDFLSYPAAAQSQDAILMLGTISNLPLLQEQLAQAHHLLKPNGLLYFNVPVCDALAPRMYGKRYWMFAPSVRTFFSRRCIRLCLEAAGFRLTRLDTDRQQPTLAKLLGHLGLRSLYPWLLKLGWTGKQLPWRIPLPGIVVVGARRQ